MSRVLGAVESTPWAILPDALEQIHAIAAREHEFDAEAIQSKRGERYGEAGRTRIRDGVAVIPVHGPIFRYANLLTAFSGATSSEMLALQVSEVLTDDAVHSIVLDVDSPGGMANGLHELSALIYEARGIKPITAFVSGTGASAAYYIASAADRVLASPSAIVGSIGTVIQVDDRSEADAKRGVRTLTFVSSQSPRKWMDPFAADDEHRTEARSQIQTIVDSLAAVFIEDVARNRGVDPSVVAREYGQGGVFVGEAAADAGLVDGITTLEALIRTQTEAQRAPGRSWATAAGGTNHPGMEVRMDTEVTTQPAAEGPDLDQVRAEAAEAERARILGILELDGPQALTADLIADADCSVGDAAVRIRLAEKEAQKAKARAHIEQRVASDRDPAPGPSASIETDESEDRALGKQAAALYLSLRDGRRQTAAA